MKHAQWPVQDQVFWYLKREASTPCREDQQADVAIIGGGMAGLMAAQAWIERGKKVILLEQYYCGSGATGKSSGFITQNAELSLTDFSKWYGAEGARAIWDFFTAGMEDIRENVKKYNFNCDYRQANTLEAANSIKEARIIKKEHETLQKLGYKSNFYDPVQLKQHLNVTGYFGAVEYEDTFGIDAYLYCQEMKKMLIQKGVLIFEDTPVIALQNHTLITASQAKIEAEHIIVCADRFAPLLNIFASQIYHAQTFLLVSPELDPSHVAQIFPNKEYMVWDVDLIYSYFRMAGNNRVLLGGGSLLTTYSGQEKHNYTRIVNKLTTYFHTKFPSLSLQFEHLWPGLIGLSKDIAPIAGRDKNNPHVYCISAAAGLPIAAALGRYSAAHMLDGAKDMDHYFDPYRKFAIGSGLQAILGKKISFALSNLIAKKW